jgi:hypothetical protein
LSLGTLLSWSSSIHSVKKKLIERSGKHYRSSTGVLAGGAVISGGGLAVEDVEADAAAADAEDARTLHLGQRPFIAKRERSSELSFGAIDLCSV